MRPDGYYTWGGIIRSILVPFMLTFANSAGRVSDGWKGVEPSPKAVTTSLVLEDILLLIRGHGKYITEFT